MPSFEMVAAFLAVHVGGLGEGNLEPLGQLVPCSSRVSAGFDEEAGCEHTGQSFIQASSPRGSIGETDLVEDVHTLQSQRGRKQNLHRSVSETDQRTEQVHEELQQQVKQAAPPLTSIGDIHVVEDVQAQDLVVPPLARLDNMGSISYSDFSDRREELTNQTVLSPFGDWTLATIQHQCSLLAAAIRKASKSSPYVVELTLTFVVLVICSILALVVMRERALPMDASRRNGLLRAADATGAAGSAPARSTVRQSPQLGRPQSPEKRLTPQAPVAQPSAMTVQAVPQSQPGLTGSTLERLEVPGSPAPAANAPLPMLCEDLVVPPSAACTLLLPMGPCAGTPSEVSVDNLEDQGVFHAAFSLDPALGGARVLTLSCCEQRHVSGELREIRYGVFASCRLSPASSAAQGVGNFQRTWNLPLATIHRQVDDSAFADVRRAEGGACTFQLSSRSGEMFFRALREDALDLNVTDARGQTLAKVATDPTRRRRTVTVLPLVDAGLVVLTTLALDWLR